MKNILIKTKIKGTNFLLEVFSMRNGSEYSYGFVLRDEINDKKYASGITVDSKRDDETALSLIMLQVMETVIELSK